MKRGECSARVSFDRVDIHPVTTDHTLEEQLLRHFNYNFSERSTDEKLKFSGEDRHFLEFVEGSISMNDGHYVIIFKNSDIRMPNNRKQAEQTLFLLKGKFD